MPPFDTPALGEIALAARDLPAMRAFYEGDLGLPLLSERPNGIVFLRLAGGNAGHTPVLALFPGGPGGGTGTGPQALHHLALSLSPRAQEEAARHLGARGHALRWQDFPRIGWRGLFLRDPDGNAVELVARIADPA